ncbi:hypothetical protein PAECIP111802_06745 [Paenibacillus allorhizosphaerae]|uniref:Uncharacterized protein n=2 Tax=Paenibacillus allorhizosphaerae TaxID=2849866 RepID=A0ABM8VT78_9BACL|nr:hypothetical protein PAECIP111802_06745 [Paenibacillus allorhizosphaerae]
MRFVARKRFARHVCSLRTGLLAEFLFQGSSRDTGNSAKYDGQVHGAVPTADRFGNPDNQFDGLDDYIVVNPVPKLNKDGFSLSVWVRYSRAACSNTCSSTVPAPSVMSFHCNKTATVPSNRRTPKNIFLSSILRTNKWKQQDQSPVRNYTLVS